MVFEEYCKKSWRGKIASILFMVLYLDYRKETTRYLTSFQVYDYVDDCVLLFIIFARFRIRRNGLLLEPRETKFSSKTE